MEPSALALFWAAVIAGAIVVYVILDGFDLGVGILFGTTRDAALRKGMMDAISPFWDGNETWLVVIGAVAVRRLPGRLRGVPAGLLYSRAAASVRADLSRRRLRVPLPWRRPRIMGLGLLSRIDGRRLCSGRRGRCDDARHSGRGRAVCRRPLRVAGASAGAHRHRPRARLCVARRGLAGAEVRGRAARMGMGEGARVWPAPYSWCWRWLPWRRSSSGIG